MIYDLAILGGGPAGVSAGVYAGRKKLNTIVITKEFGGQSVVSDNIYNWIGTKEISGLKLSENLKEHLFVYENKNFTIKENETIEKLEKTSDGFKIKTNSTKYNTKTVLIATGSKRRKLEIKGSEEFENKGITYCASCDGPLFSNQNVIVVGGGNAGFETASQLLAYTKSVTLIEHATEFKADKITIEKVLKNPKMTALKNTDISEIFGQQFVSGLKIKNNINGNKKEIKATGIFVEIGAIPATDFAKNLIPMNNFDQIIVDPKNQQTETNGVWSAGDCTNGLYHQNNIAMGDAIKALEDIYIWLKTK